MRGECRARSSAKAERLWPQLLRTRSTLPAPSASVTARTLLSIGCGRTGRAHQARPPPVFDKDPAREPFGFEEGRSVLRDDIEALARWDPHRPRVNVRSHSVPRAFCCRILPGSRPSSTWRRWRDAIATMGGDPKQINPLQPVELVIITRCKSTRLVRRAPKRRTPSWSSNATRSGMRFLKWGQAAFANYRAVPPDTGIVHQVNIEFLARVVFGAAAPAEAAPQGEQVHSPIR